MPAIEYHGEQAAQIWVRFSGNRSQFCRWKGAEVKIQKHKQICTLISLSTMEKLISSLH